MQKLIDITGKRFNNLVVVKRAENAKGGVAVWECICDCGNTTFVRGSNLKNGSVKSCGCRRKTVKHTLTHNMSNTRLYREWAGMKRRCYTKSIKAYKNYGERGIEVCEAWKDSFEAFCEWALANGYSDDLTIERIDTNGNYCPENCTWIPLNQQQRNRRTSYFIEYNGQIKNLTDWCKYFGLDYGVMHNRIHKLGWSFERAISEPVHIEKRNKRNGRIHK